MLKPEDCRPGVLVECIQASKGSRPVQVGDVYTIREFTPAEHVEQGVPAILVEELPVASEIDAGWWIGLFRLLPSDRNAKLVFRACLDPAPDRVLEEQMLASQLDARDCSRFSRARVREGR